MYSYCIIPDNPQNFLAFITQLPISSPDKELLKHSKVTKVEVDIKINTWDIFINVPKELSQQTLVLVEQKLCNDCSLNKVNFI